MRCLNTHCISILNFYYIDAIFYYNYSAEGLGTLWRRGSFPVCLTFFARAFYALYQSVFNVLPVLLLPYFNAKEFHAATDFFHATTNGNFCFTVNKFSLDLSAISWLTDDNVSAKRS